ncbi:MAG: hypothetical protein ACOX0E_07785 [Syntrophomonadaceae bacterium]|jgi:stage III sporulation protein AG
MLEEWIRTVKASDDKQPILSGKKTRYVIVIMICLGLLALIWPSSSYNGVVESSPGISASDYQPLDTTKGQIIAELEAILAQVEGAGQVEVSLTLASDGIMTYATNQRHEERETQEEDSRGVKKTSHETSTSEDLAVSSGEPLLVEKKYPQVTGVLVVADGANLPEIQERLTNATATLLQIPAHKVRVMPRKGDNNGY